MKHIILSLFLISSTLSVAQDSDTASFGSINLGLHGAEFSYESALSEKFFWENSLGLGMGSNAISGASYSLVLNNPVPYIKSELKYVYNRSNRVSKNRSIINNSGNYIALQAKYSFGDSRTFDLNQTMLTEVHWGIQRPLGKRFLFNFHVGLGLLNDLEFNNTAISPTVGVNFGYKLF